MHLEVSWSTVDHQGKSWEMVDNSLEPLSSSLSGICLDMTHLPLALASCGHDFCHQCWSRYLVVASICYLVASVNCADATLPLRCPESCCSKSVDLVTAAFILTRRQSSFPTWQTLFELSVKALPLYICHRCHRPSYLDSQTHCPCRELRCLACGQRDYWPSSCKDYALSLQLATRRLEVHVRKCPQCFEFWEKPYGCVHSWMMEKSCSRCKTKFCWHCVKRVLPIFVVLNYLWRPKCFTLLDCFAYPASDWTR